MAISTCECDGSGIIADRWSYDLCICSKRSPSPRFYLEKMTIQGGYSFEEWLSEVADVFANYKVANLPRFYDFHRDFIGGFTPDESYFRWLDID